jgi:hypothetical protein
VARGHHRHQHEVRRRVGAVDGRASARRRHDWRGEWLGVALLDFFGADDTEIGASRNGEVEPWRRSTLISLKLRLLLV